METTTQIKSPSTRKKKAAPKPESFPPDMDILAWVGVNAPWNLQELKALRYCLYHRCTRDDFDVSEKIDCDDFWITGRASKLHVVSNQARRYVLWRLRLHRKQNPCFFEGEPVLGFIPPA